MNITDNLIRIKEGKENIIKSLKNKGVSIADNTLINEIPTIIDNAEIGGGGDTPSQPEIQLIPKYEGASVFRIEVPSDGYEFAINLCNNASTATYDVDWGDGSLESGLTTDEQHHTYSKSGTYDVNIYNLSKEITLGGSVSISGSTTVTVYYLFNNSNNDYWISGRYVENKDIITVTNILIGDNVTSIGSNAFQNCSSLQSIELPSTVTSIGSNAFYNCSSLQSIVIPEGVTKIDTYVFYQCSSLQSIVIPESVTSISSNTFQNCSSLQSIDLPNSVTSIGTAAFSGCSSLQSIVIPNNVTTIGTTVFQYCYSLQSVEIPNSVTSIGNYAFNSCSSLQSIVIPEGVTSIGNYIFQNCFSLQSITCEALTAPTIQSNSFPTSSFTYTKRYLYVPKDSQGYDSGNWKTYLIDKGWELRYIEDRVKTPTTLKLKTKNNFLHKWDYIGQAKLINYELIDNEYIYHFDDKITEIPQNTFYTTVLKEIELPEGLEIIGKLGFYNCNNLHTITCKAMTAPKIQNDTFNSVGTKVPSGTPKILRIPEGSSGYEETTSQWYKQLISKGYTVEYIKPNSLTYTSTNGNTVTPYVKSFEGENEIISNTYENGIGTITFKNDLSEIYEDMYNSDIVDTTLKTFEIPNGIKNIGGYAFRTQTNLEQVTIPNSVTTIGDSAFNGCSKLTEIRLGNSVETIGQWAFSSCTKVSTITSMAMVAPTLNQSFLNVGGDVSGDKILRVPQGAEGYDTWLSQLNGFTIEYI